MRGERDAVRHVLIARSERALDRIEDGYDVESGARQTARPSHRALAAFHLTPHVPKTSKRDARSPQTRALL